jgi:hypothetical protein
VSLPFNVVTSDPETPAPAQRCPGCARPLTYRQTILNTGSTVGRCDYYICACCGPFKFQHRTRRLTGAVMMSLPRP